MPYLSIFLNSDIELMKRLLASSQLNDLTAIELGQTTGN